MNQTFIKARGVIIKNGKIFLVKLKEGGFRCLPGGTLEKNENTIQCLEREIIEELGVKPIIGKLIFVQEFFRENGLLTIDFWYNIENVNDFDNIDLSTCTHGFEHSKVGFYDFSDNSMDIKPTSLENLFNIWKKEIKFIN